MSVSYLGQRNLLKIPVKQKSIARIPDLTHHKKASYNSQLHKKTIKTKANT